MVHKLDGMELTENLFIDGFSTKMAQSGALLKNLTPYLSTGWKWAQHEDAKWMFNDFCKCEAGKMFGLAKEEL